MSFSLKDQIYNPGMIQDLAVAIDRHLPGFDRSVFMAQAYPGHWPDLELKARMYHLSDCLSSLLDGKPFPAQVSFLKKVIQELEQHNFANLIFPDFVEKNGLEDWETSMDALEHFTQFGSSEYAIRPFIVQYPQKTMERMLAWAEHPNHHVRRLASEGCRPRLPWAMALPDFQRDPSPILPILEKLKADPEDYVYRSVANNLNDISKDHPDLVLDLAERWYGQHPHSDWAVKHALRTLFKQGSPRAMALFGYTPPDSIEVSNMQMPKEISLGDQLEFAFEINNASSSEKLLRLDYRIDYRKKSGRYSSKVFKLTERAFPPGISMIQRKQWFKDMSTRKHYPGVHRLTITVNGVEMRTEEFILK